MLYPTFCAPRIRAVASLFGARGNESCRMTTFIVLTVLMMSFVLLSTGNAVKKFQFADSRIPELDAVTSSLCAADRVRSLACAHRPRVWFFLSCASCKTIAPMLHSSFPVVRVHRYVSYMHKRKHKHARVVITRSYATSSTPEGSRSLSGFLPIPSHSKKQRWVFSFTPIE